MSLQVPMTYKYSKSDHRYDTTAKYVLKENNAVAYSEERGWSENGEWGSKDTVGTGTWEVVKDGTALKVKLTCHNPDDKVSKPVDNEQEFPIGKDGLVDFGEGYKAEVSK